MLQSVRKVGTVLGLFTAIRPDWGVREVAEALDMPPSSAHNVLSSLASTGLLERQRRGRYRLGWRLAELNEVMRDGTDVVRHGEPVLRILSRQTSETAYLAIPHQDRVLCLDKILGGGPDAVRGPRIGSRVNPQVSAAGKLFLAQGAISHSRIGGRPSNPPVAPPACDVWGLGRAGDLHNIRESGATDGGESQLGITSVVAGVHNSDSRTVAAVCLVLPDSRYQRVRAPIDQAVRVAATHLSLRLGSQVSPAPMTIVHDNQDAYHGGHTREHPMHPASSA